MVLATLVLASSLTAERPSKANAVHREILLLTQLAAIAESQTVGYPAGPVAQRIDSLLGAPRELEELEALALLSFAVAGRQAAEDQNYDGVFDYAMWRCIEGIAARPGHSAALTLTSLKPILGRDGHASERFRDLIASQQRVSGRR